MKKKINKNHICGPQIVWNQYFCIWSGYFWALNLQSAHWPGLWYSKLVRHVSLGFLEAKICWTFYLEHLKHLKTKLLTNIALWNSLCTCGYKPKSEKHLFFSRPPMSLETEPQPPGWSCGVPSIPRNLEKVQNDPQPVKWATIFKASK